MLANQPSLFNATRLNMQRLIMLRSVVMVCLSLVIFILRQTSVPLPVLPLSLAIVALGLFSLVAWWRLKHTQQTHQAITQQELLLQLLGDIAALSVLFYFSGGYSNPFIWMYLLPVTVAAVALRAAYAWAVASLSITCYTLLMFYHVPLSHLHLHAHVDGQSAVQLDIHLVGMWIGFVVSSIIVAIFIARIGQNLRDYDKTIAAVREKALESERMLALGTLATSAAHELGTPLATMAVVSKELSQEYASQPELLKQLEILQKQVSRCKEILSSITRNAGQTRAESGHGLPISEFILEAIQRWRDTRPATELLVTMPSSGFDPMILIDRTLTQAILNLLDNAADESPERIVFEADWTEKLLTIQIRDFGRGLSTETKRQLGTPFFTSKNEEGMGLGVYLTQTTLARYDGELSLNNHAEGGVLTSVKLPLAKLKVAQ
ncbi:MAG: HAMP domain-containing histidine kinase [Methylotenera sp.]|nr:HAMP domain-containing histidine kinase [Methylotenera sp.]MSP99435.1 HAMP domain-containing histidine kinase [Methylotenera sp.]